MRWHELDLVVISPQSDDLKETKNDRFQHTRHTLFLQQVLSALERGNAQLIIKDKIGVAGIAL